MFALLRILSPDPAHVRIDADGKRRLLHAVDRSRRVRGVQRILRVVGLTPARLRAWRNSARECGLEDQSSCPHDSPQRLTSGERRKIREMVTSPEHRHIPTGRLAILAQRLGRVFASPSTWHRLVRVHGWCRPRLRLHPAKPRAGIRASKPDEIWHIDTTVIRLLDGTRVYLHAVLDNFSRRILSWCLNGTFDPGCLADLLVEAGARTPPNPKTGENHLLFDPLEWVHAVTTQIPDARQHLVRYQGAYANAARGLYRPAVGAEREEKERTAVRAEDADSVSTWDAMRRRSWARLLRRIYEVDPLRCRCGGELEIVSVITDPVVVDRILLHRKGKRLKSPFASRAPPGT